MWEDKRIDTEMRIQGGTLVYRLGKDKRQLFSVDEVSGEWVSSDTAWKDRHLCTLSWSGLAINIIETLGSVISCQGFFLRKAAVVFQGV